MILVWLGVLFFLVYSRKKVGKMVNGTLWFVFCLVNVGLSANTPMCQLWAVITGAWGVALFMSLKKRRKRMRMQRQSAENPIIVGNE